MSRLGGVKEHARVPQTQQCHWRTEGEAGEARPMPESWPGLVVETFVCPVKDSGFMPLEGAELAWQWQCDGD